MISTYLMRRPSLIGQQVRDRDEPVPEAHLWRLTEGMIRSGRLRPVQMSEPDFAAAVARHCPEHAEAIYGKLGVDRLQVAAVRRGRSRTVLVGAPTPIKA